MRLLLDDHQFSLPQVFRDLTTLAVQLQHQRSWYPTPQLFHTLNQAHDSVSYRKASITTCNVFVFCDTWTYVNTSDYPVKAKCELIRSEKRVLNALSEPGTGTIVELNKSLETMS